MSHNKFFQNTVCYCAVESGVLDSIVVNNSVISCFHCTLGLETGDKGSCSRSQKQRAKILVLVSSRDAPIIGR